MCEIWRSSGKVGDLVRCGDEIAVIIDITWSICQDQQRWLECYWPNGDLEGVPADEVELLDEAG